MTELSMDSEASKAFQRENWIRCASEEDFAKFMVTEFGETSYTIGFQTVTENKQLIYEDVGDGNYEKLHELL